MTKTLFPTNLVTLALIFNPFNPVQLFYTYSVYLPTSFSVTGTNIVDVKDCTTAPVE